jgi:hypothetical protein
MWRTSSYTFARQNCVEVNEGFRKSSFSASGNCAEIGHDYRTSSHSSVNGQCAEVASGVLVRDTKQDGQPDRTVLEFSPGAWTEFLNRVRETA